MSDVTLACALLLTVLLAGSLRAFLDRNVAIFYLSACAVAVMSAPLALEHIGVVIQDAVLIFLGVVLLIFATLIDNWNRTQLVLSEPSRKIGNRDGKCR